MNAAFENMVLVVTVGGVHMSPIVNKAERVYLHINSLVIISMSTETTGEQPEEEWAASMTWTAVYGGLGIQLYRQKDLKTVVRLAMQII